MVGVGVLFMPGNAIVQPLHIKLAKLGGKLLRIEVS